MRRSTRLTLLLLAPLTLILVLAFSSCNPSPSPDDQPDRYLVGPPLDLPPDPPSHSTHPPPPPDLRPPPAPCALTVDWTDTHQTIVGFGGTLSWIHPPVETSAAVFKALFDDLGVSVLRVQALGAETGDEGSLEPENDNDDPNLFNWDKFPAKTTEAKNAILIQAAQAHGIKTIIPTAWSPPAWMKSNNSRVGGTLKETMIDEYAECWAAYLIALKRDFHLEVPYISLQNEPDLTYTYPTCGISEELYAKAAAKIAARLKKENIATQILGPDTCRLYHLESYLEQMQKENVALRSPALTHLYDLAIPFDVTAKDRARWEAAHAIAQRFHRPLWQMECSNYLSSNAPKGSYEEALIWAEHVHWMLTAGDCQVVCYWSLFFDKKGETLIYCPKTEDPHYERLPVYYTSMNYFRPIRPGMVRCTAGSSDSKMLVSAFRSPDTLPAQQRREILVVINTDTIPRPITLPALTQGAWIACVTTATSQFVPTRLAANSTTLEPRSVTTLVHVLPEPPAESSLDDIIPLYRPPAPKPPAQPSATTDPLLPTSPQP